MSDLENRRSYFKSVFDERKCVESQFFYLFSDEEKEVFDEEFAFQKLYERRDLMIRKREDIVGTEEHKRYINAYPESKDAKYYISLDCR